MLKSRHLKGNTVLSRMAFLLVLAALVFTGLAPMGVTGAVEAAQGAESGADADADERVVLERAAQLTALLLADEYEAIAEAFAPELAAMVDVDQLRAAWVTLPGQVGALQHIGTAYVDDWVPIVIVRTPLQYERAALDLLFGFNEQLELMTFTFVPHVPRLVEGPPYVDESRFEEYVLSFGEAAFPLEGTLTLPRGDGPFPAVVLVHGSGPHDRDETVGPNKPFRDIAHGLASHGIAVFRYDKRTLVHGQAMANVALTVQEETITDAVLAVGLLAERADIGDVYVLGHSLGGMVAPYIAEQAPELHGIIIAAGNARPLGVLLVEQVEYLLDGHAVPGSEQSVRAMQADAERLRAGDFAGLDTLLGVPVEYWIDLNGRDQVAALAALPHPTLILQGERDYQVPAVDLEVWQRGLANRDNVQFRLYPYLNHLFLHGEGPATPNEYMQPGFVDAQVIVDVVTFVHGL